MYLGVHKHIIVVVVSVVNLGVGFVFVHNLLLIVCGMGPFWLFNLSFLNTFAITACTRWPFKMKETNSISMHFCMNKQQINDKYFCIIHKLW